MEGFKTKQSSVLFGQKPEMDSDVEAPTGIEPVYTVLQTVASPLRHSAIVHYYTFFRDFSL